MQKKYIYLIVGLIVVVLGYFNYYTPEAPIKKATENLVEISNVTYESGDYQIQAEKQIDNMDKNETKFNMAKALFSNMDLSGNNVFIDKAKNMILKNNIMGISANGWTFNTEKARYVAADKKIYSEEGVTATNKEKGIEVYGKNFETDESMSYVKLEDDIEVKNEKFILTADKAYYSDDTKILNISGDIRIKGNNLGKSATGVLTGKFKKMKYNTNTNILEAWEPFVANYNGVDLYGEKLWYDENTGDFKVWKNVRAEKGTFVVYGENIVNDAAKDTVTFKGPIHGGDETYKIKANNGYYNTKSGIATLVGNLVITSIKGEKLVADKGVYNTNINEIEAISNSGNVVYTAPDKKIVSKKFRYNTNSEEVWLDQNYTYTDAKYESKGNKFYYNSLSGVGKVTKGNIKSDTFFGSGNLVDFDTKKKYHIITGNAILKQDGYTLSGDKVIYNEAINKVTIPNNYKIVNKTKGEDFRGRNATYNTQTGALYSPGKFYGRDVTYDFEGLDLRYNNKSGVGSIGSNVKLKNRSDGTILTGDRGEFKKGEYSTLIGNVILNNPKYVAYASKANYKVKENAVYIPGNIRIDGKDGSKGTMVDGKFDLNVNAYSGNNFVGTQDTSKIKGDKVKYYLDSKIFELRGNVEVEDPQTKLTGSQLEYHTQNGDIFAQEPYKIYYSNLVIDSTRGKFNLDTKNLDGENVVIVSDKGERIAGNQIYGSFLDKTLDITGDVDALIYNVDKTTGKKDKILYNGDSARVYFIDDNGLKASRSEIRDNGVFKYQGMTMYSDYVEIDLNKNLALGRRGSRIVMDNGIDVISEIADMNLNTEEVELINDVEITNIDPKSGYKKATADRGIIRNKEQVTELIGRVHAETDTAKIDADKGIYDMKTSKFKAMGNVFIDYNMN